MIVAGRTRAARADLTPRPIGRVVEGDLEAEHPAEWLGAAGLLLGARTGPERIEPPPEPGHLIAKARLDVQVDPSRPAGRHGLARHGRAPRSHQVQIHPFRGQHRREDLLEAALAPRSRARHRAAARAASGRHRPGQRLRIQPERREGSLEVVFLLGGEAHATRRSGGPGRRPTAPWPGRGRRSRSRRARRRARSADSERTRRPACRSLAKSRLKRWSTMASQWPGLPRAAIPRSGQPAA